MSITNQTMNKLQITATMQDKYGIGKYGKPLDHTDNFGWMDMAFEELSDLSKYMICEMNRKNDVIALLEKALEEGSFLLVMQALKILEIKGTGK